MKSLLSKTGTRITLLAISIVISLYLAFFAISPEAGFAFLRFAGPHYLAVLLFAFLLFAGFVIRRLISKEDLPPMHVLALLLLAIVFTNTREPQGFKVIQDDIVLSAIAMNIHLNRLQEVPMGGHTYEGRYHLKEGYLDKRPALFSTILAFVHDVTGYRIENAFYLNQFLTALLLVMLFALTRQLSGSDVAALFTTWLFAAIPIVASNATGSGFEVLNLVMIVTTLGAALLFWKHGDSSSLLLLTLAAVLLSYVRYESVLFVFMTGAIIGAKWWQQQRVNIPLALCLVPLLMIPAVLQLNVSFHNELLWQLESAEKPFGINYIQHNIGAAVSYLLSPSGAFNNSPLVFLLGLPAMIILLVRVTTKPASGAATRPGLVLVLFAVTIIVQFTLVMGFFAGDLETFAASRYILPMYLLMTIAVGLLTAEVANHRAAATAMGAILFANIFFTTLPATTWQNYSHARPVAVQTNWVLEYLDSLPAGNHLLIHPRPWIYTLHQIPVTQLSIVNATPWELAYHMQNDTYDKVLLVQEVISAADLPEQTLFGSAASDQIVMNEVARMSYAPYQFLKLSEVTAINMAPSMKAPPGKQNGGQKNIQRHESFVSTRLDPEKIELWYQFLP